MSHPNDCPSLTTNAEISVQEGREVVITSAMLQVSDDSPPAEIVYRILALPEEGSLRLNGNPLVVGNTFTQADINSDRLTYWHNSSDTLRDRFSFSVSEHLGGLVTRIAIAPDGTQSDGNGSGRYVTQISADGRYVLFDSLVSNWVDGDTNNRQDLFVYDRHTGVTSRVSVGTGGTQADGNSYEADISADGRFVVFESFATNLVNDDINETVDIFLHDRQTGETIRVSEGVNGGQVYGGSGTPAISANGRYIAFTSVSDSLVNDDNNGVSDVFVYDHITGETERISIASDGTEAAGSSFQAWISADGRYVAFISYAANLVAGDTNNLRDVFVHDRQTKETTRVSIASDGTQRNRPSQFSFTDLRSAISGDGRFVVFESGSSNLTPNNRIWMTDIFLHDRLTGETSLVSSAPDGTPGNGDSIHPSISPDGRYITFVSSASNLVEGHQFGQHIFVHDRLTGRKVRIPATETGGHRGGAVSSINPSPTISADGRYIAFSSWSADLVSGDTNRSIDTFVYDAGAILASASIVIQPVTDGATILTAATPLFFAGHADKTIIDGTLRVTSEKTALARATIAIENYSGQEQLHFTDQNGISGRFDAATGILTLTGSASPVDYQTALRSITYTNGNNNPALVRTIRFQVNDGTTDSPIATRTVHVDSPALIHAGIVVQPGKAVTVTREMLQVRDLNNSPEQLIYTLTSLPANGTLRLDNQILAINDTFTQADIDSGRLVYFNHTQSPSDRFDFTFSDGNYISRISVDSSGQQTNGDVHPLIELPVPGLSADGRFIVYASGVSNLVNGDTNQARDIFVFDRETGQTTRVSIATDGTQGNGLSDSPSISADGRFVAFWSEASNLVENDTNNVADTFVHDRLTGITERISISSAGVQGDGGSWGTSISADGRFVTYSSNASNLVSGDTNTQRDVFVFDRETRQTTRVSVDSNGNQGNGLSRYPWISGNGQFVAFHSEASNLVSGDTNRLTDVFVHDRQTGQTLSVSGAARGMWSAHSSFDPMLSTDGRFVIFESSVNNLVSGDTNNQFDIFVHDRVTGETICISRNVAGAFGNGDSLDPAISADGRYITFASDASNLIEGDTNHQTDVFKYDRETKTLTRLSQNGSPANGGSYAPMIASDGQSTVFYSMASNLVSDDTNNQLDMFVSSTRRISGSAAIAIRDNQAPVLRQAISDQTATEATPFQLTIPADTFADSDSGDRLVYSATLANGNSLPLWLSFDASTGTFRGIPPQSSAGRLNLKVIATDSAGAAISDEFEIGIADDNSNSETGTGSPSDGAGNNSGTASHSGGNSSRHADNNPVNSSSQPFEASGNQNQGDRLPAQPPRLLLGTHRTDRLEGGDAADFLMGMAGGDYLIGNGGDDRLVGGTGQDELSGGAGADRFVYSVGRAAGGRRDSTLSNLDRITDFNTSEGDCIQLDFDGNGSSIERPNGLFNVGRQQGRRLQDAIESAFRDKNQRQRGNQTLRANEAVFLTWRGRTFLAVNDSPSRSRHSGGVNFSPRHDLVIEMTGMKPIAAGMLNVETYFA